MSSAGGRLETGDEDGSGAIADAAPAAALALAQEQENARVTLYRCMRTVLRMLAVRGYVVTTIGSQCTNHEEALEAYKSKARAEAAEEGREVIITAEVATNPPRFSTAWANALAPGTRLGVVAVGQGNVEAVRDVLEKMVYHRWQTVLLVSRMPLTAYSAKELAVKTPAGKTSQHFKYVDLQAAIVDHCMVPKHAPLDATMAARVRAKFAGGQFPRLLTSDSMVQFLGMPVGSIISVREVFGREQPVTTHFEVSEV